MSKPLSDEELTALREQASSLYYGEGANYEDGAVIFNKLFAEIDRLRAENADLARKAIHDMQAIADFRQASDNLLSLVETQEKQLEAARAENEQLQGELDYRRAKEARFGPIVEAVADVPIAHGVAAVTVDEVAEWVTQARAALAKDGE